MWFFAKVKAHLSIIRGTALDGTCSKKLWVRALGNIPHKRRNHWGRYLGRILSIVDIEALVYSFWNAGCGNVVLAIDPPQSWKALIKSGQIPMSRGVKLVVSSKVRSGSKAQELELAAVRLHFNLSQCKDRRHCFDNH